METTQMDCDVQPDKDDSGCVQDGSLFREINLLDLSDDVLLYILRLCSPRDLKALGYTCSRLGSLVQERSLWRYVDARNEVFSKARLQWYLTHMLHKETHVLRITGHAKNCEGCLGLIDLERKASEGGSDTKEKNCCPKNDGDVGTSGGNISVVRAEDNISVMRENILDSRHIFSPRFDSTSRYRGILFWHNESEMGRAGPQQCIGPQFTLTPLIMKQLKNQCNLTELSLEYCNVDCKVINLSQFPETLKKLSLRGTKFFNLITEKSFLTKISNYLPELAYIDLSECEWLEPLYFLPLSKHPALTHLIAQECYRLYEFVAYAALTARYGFRNLKVLDLRGSPVGDSEVAALGWLPSLEELWLSAPRKTNITTHAHFLDDEIVPHVELDDWELQEPEYYQGKVVPETMEVEDELPCRHVPFNPNDSQPSTSKDDSTNSKNADDNSTPKKRDRDDNANGNDDGNSDDDDDGPGPKRRRRDPGIRFIRMRMRQRTNPNPESVELQDLLLPMMTPPTVSNVSNVIVFAGPSQPPAEANRPNRVYYVCPEHASVEKTDKATETDNTNNEVCNCHAKPKETNEQNKTNENANNSNNPENNAEQNPESPNDADFGIYVRFRRNQTPVVNYINSREVNREPRNENEGNPQVSLENISQTFIEALLRRPNVSTNQDQRREPNDSSQTTNDKDSPESQPGPSGSQAKPSDETNAQKSPSSQNASGTDQIAQPERTEQREENERSDREDENSPRPCSRSHNLNGSEQNFSDLIQNISPIIPDSRPRNENQDRNQNGPREARREFHYHVEPGHHVLYVNVGPNVSTFRLPRYLGNNQNFFESHISESSRVTDFSIRRFGRAEGEDVNVIHLGPNGPIRRGNAPSNDRPDRSNLRILSVTGYRSITNRSLQHLISAAPNLRRLDFSRTSVTEAGVENFRSLRPDCEIIHSPFDDGKSS